MEENNTRFTSEVTYDPLLFREYYQAFQDNSARVVVARLYLLFVSAALVLFMDNNTLTHIFLAFAIVVFLSDWYNHRKNRDGGLNYKQMLHQFEGDIPHQLVLFREDQIVRRNMRSGNELNESYQNIRKIWETSHLLLLVTDLKLYHVIDKRQLTGGDSDELIRFLREKCPMLKKVRRGSFGRFVRWLCWAVLAFGILWSILGFFHVPDKLAGQITNDVSYEQMAEELTEVGITISPQTITELEQYDSENRAGMYLDSNSRVLDLLCWEGQGIYEKNVFYQDGISEAYDWDWTPSASGVYWFDTEVFNFGSIYTDFLAGICAMDEQLNFSNIEEKYIRVDIPSGKGEIDFSFDYEGTHYELTAEYNFDWFDTDMLYAVGRILANDDDPKDLWFTHDGGQGLLLYYGTEENMQLLEKITGTDFLDCVTMHMGH